MDVNNGSAAPSGAAEAAEDTIDQELLEACHRAERDYVLNRKRERDVGVEAVVVPIPTRFQRAARGEVRVAKYYPGKGMPPTPAAVGWRNVLIHSSDAGIGGPLSPYQLRNEHGQLLENIWQYAKIYSQVTAQRQHKSRFQPHTIIWEHPTEVHLEATTGEPTEAYWAWRAKGMNNAYAVRYPNGYHGRTACVCSIWSGHERPDRAYPSQYERLDYIAARKRIYCGEYARLAPNNEAFRKLVALLANGENLQIVEVDGPDPQLTYPPYDQISAAQPGMPMNEANIGLLINDARKPFGHGFVIAALLLGGAEWLK